MKFQTPALSSAEPSHHKDPTTGRVVYLFQRNQVPWAIWLQNWFLTLCFLPGSWCLNHQEGCSCLEFYLPKAVSSTCRAWLHNHKHKGKMRKGEIWLLPWPSCMSKSRIKPGYYLKEAQGKHSKETKSTTIGMLSSTGMDKAAFEWYFKFYLVGFFREKEIHSTYTIP